MDKSFYHPMNAVGILDRVTYIFKKTFWHQLISSLIIYTISAIMLYILFLFLTIIGIGLGIVASIAYSPEFGVFLLAAFCLVVVTLFVGAMYSAFNSLSMCLSKQYFYKQTLSFSDAFMTSLKSLLRVSSTVIACFLIYFVVLLLVFSIFFVFLFLTFGFTPSSFTLSFLNADVLNIAFILSLFLFCFFVGIILLILHSFFCIAVPISLFEKKWFYSAITESVKYVKKNFLNIFCIKLIFMVSMYLINVALSSTFDLVFLAVGIFGKLSTPSIGTLAMSWSSNQIYFLSILSVCLASASPILQTIIYFNQKINYEGLDIEIGISHMEKNVN